MVFCLKVHGIPIKFLLTPPSGACQTQIPYHSLPLPFKTTDAVLLAIMPFRYYSVSSLSPSSSSSLPMHDALEVQDATELNTRLSDDSAYASKAPANSSSELDESIRPRKRKRPIMATEGEDIELELTTVAYSSKPPSDSSPKSDNVSIHLTKRKRPNVVNPREGIELECHSQQPLASGPSTKCWKVEVVPPKIVNPKSLYGERPCRKEKEVDILSDYLVGDLQSRSDLVNQLFPKGPQRASKSGHEIRAEDEMDI
jgi:hypothetical protein